MEKPRLPGRGMYVRGCGTVADIQPVPPPPPPPIPEQEYIFAEKTASVLLCLKDGTPIRALETVNEFYGEGTATTSAIEDANEYMTRHGIHTDSDVVIIVVEKTEHRRMRPIPGINNMAPEFVSFQAPQYGSKRDVPDDVRKLVWSSARVAEEWKTIPEIR